MMKVDVMAVWPPCRRWMVYRKMRCPGTTRMTRTLADLELTSGETHSE